MPSRIGSTRARSKLLLVSLVFTGVGWMGCATSNGDPTEDEEPGPVPTSTSKPDAASRPDFEAGFPTDENDAGNGDPTPDGGDTCVDKDDPGGAENTAKVLPSTDDGVDTTTTVKGVLNGPVDVDFYKLSMADKTGSVVGADIQTQTSGVELCVFVKCKGGGATTVSGCKGGVIKTSDIGTKGCCATGPSQAAPDWDCTGFTDDDSADFFVRVRQTQDKCAAYTWSYVF